MKLLIGSNPLETRAPAPRWPSFTPRTLVLAAHLATATTAAIAAAGSTGCASAAPENAEQSESDLSSALLLGAVEGASTSRTFAVSGKVRAETPSTYNWSCGTGGWATSLSNVAWVEVKNTNTQSAVVSVHAGGAGQEELFVYDSATPKSLDDCTAFSATGSLANNRSVVIEANQSVFVLVATGDATGAYTLTAKIDAFAPVATKNVSSLTLASGTGISSAVTLAVNGKVRANTPSTYNWSCGIGGWATSSSNVAWVEIENPNAQTAVISVQANGAGREELFVYDSATPKSLDDCTTFSATGSLTSNRSVVIEAKKSVFVLVAVGGATGAYTLSAKVDAFAPLATKNVSTLTLTSATGVSSAVNVAISGKVRANTPSTYNWSCGTGGWPTSLSNVAWVEIENTNAQTAVVSVQANGAGREELFVYDSATPKSIAHERIWR